MTDVGNIAHARLVFVAIGLDVVLMFMNYLFAGILYGWQRYHAKNLIDMAGWLINAALGAFLERYGLFGLAVTKLATDALALAGTILVCARTFPDLRPRAVTRKSFAELLGLGSRVFVSATTTRIATHAQPIIISTWLSSAATAFYGRSPPASCRCMGMSPAALFGQMHLRPLVVGAGAYGAAWLLGSKLGKASYPQIALGAAVALVVYVGLALLVAIGPAERRWARDRLGRLRPAAARRTA